MYYLVSGSFCSTLYEISSILLPVVMHIFSVREEEFSLYPSEFLAETPVIKD